MRALVSLLFAAVALAAPASAAETSSGIRGLVLRGPTQPVCTIGTPCEEPAARELLSVTRGGRIVARIRTGSDGRFRVSLAPGRYTVATTASGFGRSASPVFVLVRSGRYARVTLRIDTGIR
ncbi:MAG: carboxypeptidase-like regulatory domain-containing protein [Gaiellaceae bacterium MAG52_C11]|nr:carboxypeptidase-like regulatory domain-containing protein [Candidatus Gaiellasilicea maunaloa]